MAGLVTWTTSVPATTQVEYGLTAPAYGLLSPYEANRQTSHTVQLTGLTAGATYHYRVRSRNQAGTELVGADQTFTVGGALITGTVSWTTDFPASSQVEYGPTAPAYGTLTKYNPARTTSHTVQLTGLTQGATYHYRVRSRNVAGTEVVSADNTIGVTSSLMRAIVV